MKESSSRMIEAVVFDLDGLLVNTEDLYQHVGTEMLRRRGHTFDADLLDAMMGRPQQVALQVMIDWHSLPDTIETLAVETKEIFQGLLDSRLDPMPGAVSLVEDLVQRGLPRGVATSSGPDFAHDVLGRVGLLDRFGFVLTSANVTHGKPHPEIYETAARRLGWCRSGCSCLKTRRPAAQRPSLPARWRWPCREATAGGTNSPGRGSSPTRSPIPGS